MNKITGKVTLASSNTGIPNLLVVVYDIDPDARPEEIIAGLPSKTNARATQRATTNPKRENPKNELGHLGDRIGSVLTEADGSFNLEYEDADYQIRNPREKRPDLFLMVFAPEQMGKSLLQEESLLFYSPEIRQDAGRIESYFIQITEEQIKKAGLQAHLDVAGGSVKANFGSMQFFRKESIGIAQELIKGEKETQDKIKKVIDEKAWSSFFNLKEKPDMKRAPVEQIKKNNLDNISKINKEVFQNKKAKGKTVFVQVPDDQYENLKTATADEQSKIIEKIIVQFDDIAIEGAIFKTEYSTPLDKSEKEKLMEKLTQQVQSTNANSGNGTIPNQPTNGQVEGEIPDINNYVKRLIDPMQSPEQLLIDANPKLNENASRPDGDTINENLKSLEFKGGPADVPAFYDFHSLQIAFPHVWQELVDNDVIEITKDLLAQLVEDGVDISEITDEEDLKEALQGKVKHVENTTKIVNNYAASMAIPTSNAADSKPKSTSSVGIKENSSVTNNVTSKALIPITQSGLLLKDLMDLLNEKSKFTVFKEGFINYGILVTYRQKWVPLNYGAERLNHGMI